MPEVQGPRSEVRSSGSHFFQHEIFLRHPRQAGRHDGLDAKAGLDCFGGELFERGLLLVGRRAALELLEKTADPGQPLVVEERDDRPPAADTVADGSFSFELL